MGERETYIVCSLLNGVTYFWIHAIANVDDRGGLLEDGKCFNQGWWKSLCGTANVKVLQGAVDGVSDRVSYRERTYRCVWAPQ